MAIFALLALFAELTSNVFASHPTNLWIGTGGWPHTSGMNFPGATTPFGMVRLSPDTKPELLSKVIGLGNYATAGYGYADRKILGFSHTRLSGTGVRVGGSFRVLPVSTLENRPRKNRALRFYHRDEIARPGYYAVKIPKEKITTELTSSPHCGFHRYRTSLGNDPFHALLDVTSELLPNSGPMNGRLTIDSTNGVFQGEVSTRSVDAQPNDKLRVYFYAKPSVPLGHYRVWSGKKWIDDQPTEIRGEDIGIVLDSMNTPSYGGEIGLSLCISYVSALNAKLNFDAEAASTPFDQARISAEAKWKEYFSRAEIKTPDRDLETLFYSTLYFSAIMPTNFTDVNHEYRGFGNTIGKAENFTYRTDLSLWDTFRTAHPLYNLIAPEIQRDTVLSLMEMAKENHGVFPRLAYGTTSSKYMFGSPANFVLSEAYAKGIHDFDTESALLSMWKGANEDPFTREPECVLHGYCPSDEIPQSVSKTVENSWADFAAAELAHASGNPSMELRFRENEVGFRHVWDPSTRYFRPKNSAGEFTAFNPNMTSYFAFIYKPAIAYAEGGPNHYRFSAPHHAQELISLFGGPAEFVTELEKFMDGHSPRRSALYPGANYWHGDEHNIHAPYLFNEAGRPDLTQKWVRWILRDRYATTPDGLDGNDDAGTLSAWYVLSSLGLYPQSGTDRYWLGSPAVDEATLDLGGGHKLKIFARGQSSENVYVKQVALNGKRLCASTVLHQALVDSTLEFQMSATPVATYTCSP